MADPIQKGVNSSSPASPGLSGAIKDAVGAIADAVAPRSITQRKAKVDTAVDAQTGQHSDQDLARMRRGQSTDYDNL